MLHILTEDEAYMPDGSFSKDVFIRNMEKMVHEASDDGYRSFRAVGDESFIVRNGVDIKEWFAAESELNKIVPDYPHFFFCLYDLDLFDGDTVMYVLRTHPRVYVNGIIIGNPHYQAESPGRANRGRPGSTWKALRPAGRSPLPSPFSREQIFLIVNGSEDLSDQRDLSLVGPRAIAPAPSLLAKS